jgi:hypothetical protein
VVFGPFGCNYLEVDGCEVSSVEAITALGVVARGFFCLVPDEAGTAGVWKEHHRVCPCGCHLLAAHVTETALPV